MWSVILERIRQKKRTHPYPRAEVTLPARMRNLPRIDQTLCGECVDRSCAGVCPTGALRTQGEVAIDLGACLFCLDCMRSCAKGGISFTVQHAMATDKREDLIFSGGEMRLAHALEKQMLRVFGRSLKLRQVSAGGCNACEADTNVLNTLFFDLGRFGVQFVASPRHADGILVTGPISRNMELALRKTYEAVPDPKIVIACGTCSISGGIYRDHSETLSGISSIFPVNLFIPGCPPHPMSILDGLMRLLGKIEQHPY
jgi:Ni,Fe-hydrogenase III small subunit/formate hydrogenlyase subunit 6/NADH:ubiquinone oxidoreductase subunit I